jgi:SAM-dependent methyltransferase
MTSERDNQAQIDRRFDAESSYWVEVYGAGTFAAAMFHERMAAALAWVVRLGLPLGARLLEVGCGAGLLTQALAEVGFVVDAIDSSPEMVALARERIAELRPERWVNVSVADVHSLPQADGSYAVVVGVGLVPWLHSPALAFAQLARVLAPGGHVVLTANNRARLNFVLDPRYNPWLVFPLKRRIKKLLYRLGWLNLLLPNLHYRREVDRLLADAGLEKVESRTVGFGPLSFLGLKLLPDSLSVSLHGRLQRLADRGVPGLRSGGMNYLVVARKGGSAR